MDIFREAVSKNKRRFKEDGYNLDLSYISSDFIKQSLLANGASGSNQNEVSTQPHKQLIAMGYPAKRIEASYRNKCEDVLRFLDERHPEHYKVFNLCTERKYSLDSFGTRSVVEDYGFEDHKPPQFQSIGLFCQEVSNYLKNPENVAVIHCKAGKGRTGVMICCYLIHLALLNAEESGWYDFAKRHPKNPLHALVDAALNHFSRERTHDSKGVTIPSQRRYVELYAIFLSALQSNLFNPLKEQHRTYRCLESISFEHNSAPGTWSVELCFRLPHELPHYQENFFNYTDSSWAQQSQCYNHEVYIDSDNIDKIFIYSHEHQPASVHTWKRRCADTHHSTFLLHEDFCIKFRRKDQFEFEFWFNARFLKDNLCRAERHLFFEVISFKDPQQQSQNKLKKLLVLQRNQIDKIYKNKFDEKFSNCRIICQFGEEKPLDRNTWRTFFTQWSRAIQPKGSKGGVWNVISSTINGYTKGSGPIPPDAPTSRPLDRAISLSQPNLFAPEESSVPNGGSKYPFNDTSMKKCNMEGGAQNALECVKRDTLEEKMKIIDDDNTSEDDDDCLSPTGSSAMGFGALRVPLNNPYNRSSHIYRCLRSSERYGRPQRDTRSGGRGEELGGHFSDFGSSQPSSSLSSQLRPPQLQRKENNRVSPSPDNRLHSKSAGVVIEKHSLSPQGSLSSAGSANRTPKGSENRSDVSSAATASNSQGARLSSSSFCKASSSMASEGDGLQWNSLGSRNNQLLLDDQRLTSQQGQSHPIEDSQSFYRRVFAAVDQPLTSTGVTASENRSMSNKMGPPSQTFDLSASLPASSIYIPRGPPAYERNRVFNLVSPNLVGTDSTDAAAGSKDRNNEIRSAPTGLKSDSKLTSSSCCASSTDPTTDLNVTVNTASKETPTVSTRTTYQCTRL